MTQQKTSNLTVKRWDEGNFKGKNSKATAHLGFSMDLPDPIPNPLSFTVTVSGCSSNPTITAWLTDGDGNQTFANVTPPTVSFGSMPGGNYTLTVQVQCGSSVLTQSQDITLPNPSSAERRRARRVAVR